MKKLFIFSAIVLGLYACGNANTEKQEEAARDSSDQVLESKNEAYVDSLMKAEEARDTAAGAESHEGHDHAGHEGHQH